MQGKLERIYEVASAHRVEDFVITDRQLAERLDNSHSPRQVDEKLLISQGSDRLDLSLFLSANVIARLSKDDPHNRLHQGNLADYCTVLEGVSHFVCVAWNAAVGKSVTPLELELQAEIDKYVSLLGLIGHQRGGRIPANLNRKLFEDVSFDATLKAEELDRYRDANRYAGKYCHGLEHRYLRRRGTRHGSLLNELRRFYRMPLTAKIRRIESMN